MPRIQKKFKIPKKKKIITTKVQVFVKDYSDKDLTK